MTDPESVWNPCYFNSCDMCILGERDLNGATTKQLEDNQHTLEYAPLVWEAN